MLFPGRRIDGMRTINQERGVNSQIADRLDLTVDGRVPAKTSPPALPSAKLRGNDECRSCSRPGRGDGEHPVGPGRCQIEEESWTLG